MSKPESSKGISVPLRLGRIPASLQDYAQLAVGGVLLSLNFHIFVSPAHIAPGGVSGLTLIINRFTGWPIGLILFGLNIPLLIVGFFNLGKYKFLTRTFVVVVVYSALVDVWELVWPLPHGVTQDLLLNAVYGGVLGGLGNGLVFRGRGTPGGTGIISRVLQFRTGIPTSQLYLLIDGGVIAGLGLVFGWEQAMYSMLMLFLWGLATDYILEGPSVVRMVFIITDYPKEVAEGLLIRLGVGVTGWPGKGMFTGEEHRVLFCAVSRPDVGDVYALVAEIDPHAFIVIGHGHQARGGILRQRGGAPPPEG